MPDRQLAQLIEQYHAGLNAEMSILARVRQVSLRQRDAAAAHDLDAFHTASDDRDALMLTLADVEVPLRNIRALLSQHREDAGRLAGYRETIALHERVVELAQEIFSVGEESVAAFTEAEAARRVTARAIQQGETTLSAYRRVTNTAAGGATLVDCRG